MVVLRDATGMARSSIHDCALRWELDHGVDFSTKILSENDFERLHHGPERFWRDYQRDETSLWPTS